MALLLCLMFGGFVGWVGSLVIGTDTSEGILVDIFVGALAAMTLALLLANYSIFDNLIAAYLGSVIGLALLYVIRIAVRRRAHQVQTRE